MIKMEIYIAPDQSHCAFEGIFSYLQQKIVISKYTQYYKKLKSFLQSLQRDASKKPLLMEF
jgi:hypothetical protein